MSTNIVPISDLRRQASQVVNTVREGGAVYITQHGRPAAVLVDFEAYEALLAELDTLKVEAVKYNQSRPTYVVAEERGAFSALAEMAQDLGVDDLAEQHDHYLYGVAKS
jgi:prevent-host-death family protein